jgi:hypothetical protein
MLSRLFYLLRPILAGGGPDLVGGEEALRVSERGKRVADHGLRRAIHGRGIDHAAARGKEGAHHLGAGVSRHRVVADIEGDPAAEPDQRQRLAARRDRLREEALLRGKERGRADRRRHSGCAEG